jgi:hypothetical protein
MMNNGSDEYIGVIPGFPNDTGVNYYVWAFDNANNSAGENTRSNYFVTMPVQSYLNVDINVINIDTKNLTATSVITVRRPTSSREGSSPFTN